MSALLTEAKDTGMFRNMNVVTWTVAVAAFVAIVLFSAFVSH